MTDATTQAHDGYSEDQIVALVVDSGLVADAEAARMMVELDVVRIDTLASDPAHLLVTVNGRQGLADASTVATN